MFYPRRNSSLERRDSYRILSLIPVNNIIIFKLRFNLIFLVVIFHVVPIAANQVPVVIRVYHPPRGLKKGIIKEICEIRAFILKNRINYCKIQISENLGINENILKNSFGTFVKMP